MLGGGGEPCTLCSKRVYPAERINTVSGRVYHKTCFVCTKCTRKLTPSQCCEDGVTGRLYCEAHYRQLAALAVPQLVPNGTAAARIVEAGDAACDGEAEQQDIDAATPAGELVGGDDDQSEDWAADVDADEAGGEAESESRAEGEAGVVRVRVGASSSSSTS